MKKFTPPIGIAIDKAVSMAITFADIHQESVVFDFNGITVTVEPGSDADKITDQWAIEMQRKSQAYLNSPEGIRAKTLMEERMAHAQKRVTEIEEAFPTTVTDMDATLQALSDYATHGDRIDVKTDKQKILCLLESEGYVINFGVGEPREFFDDKTHLGQYIIGQAMDFLAHGSNPHPCLTHFVTKYQCMP